MNGVVLSCSPVTFAPTSTRSREDGNCVGRGAKNIAQKMLSKSICRRLPHGARHNSGSQRYSRDAREVAVIFLLVVLITCLMARREEAGVHRT